MEEYLVEIYVARSDACQAADGAESARAAAEELTRRGINARYCRSIFVPTDETCFVLFEAESLEVACDLARLAKLPAERVSAVVTHT